MWYVRLAKAQTSLCLSLDYSMVVKLLNEHHFEFLSLKRGCTCSSEYTLVLMPHCWKSHVTAQMYSILVESEMPLIFSLMRKGPAEEVFERTENGNSDLIICVSLTILMGGSRRGEQGVRTPLKNQKNMGFHSNTGPDPLKKHKATKPAFNIGQPSARQRNAI